MVVYQPGQVVFFLKTNLSCFPHLFSHAMCCQCIDCSSSKVWIGFIGKNFPEHELHLNAGVGRKDQCIFAIYKQLPINLI